MKLLLTILLFVSVNCFATKYYVKNGGSDAANGLSEATAWATIVKVNSSFSGFSAGDSILFKRGDTFYGNIIVNKSGNSSNSIVVSAYGSGAWPLFLGSKKENSVGDWTNVGGNIWENTDASFTVDVANIVFNNEASCGKKLMNSDSSLLSTQGDFWYSFTRDALRVYSTSNPATFYTNIECVLKKDAISMNSNQYLKFEKLDFRYYGICVWSYGGNFITFDSINIKYIGGADQSNNYATRYGNGLQMWEGIHDVTITNCRIDQCYDAGISPQGYSGSYSTYNLYMRHNVITNCEYSFEFYLRPGTASAHDIYFENNTCTNAGGSWAHNERPDGANGSHIRLVLFTASKADIYIRNNIFSGSTDRLFWLGSPPDITGMTINYNLWYQTGSEYFAKVSGVNYSTFTQYKSITSSDPNSINSNPLLNSEFKIQAGSLAISSGLSGTYMGAFPYLLVVMPGTVHKIYGYKIIP